MLKSALPLKSLLLLYHRQLIAVFAFATVLNTSTASRFSSSPTYTLSTGRFGRQLGFGGNEGGIGSDSGGVGYVQPYNRRQQSAEVNFFQTMMSLNFDMGDVLAMYRNVTAMAETPGCYGHCRTPMALWVVQSFYPCHNLKKADCPKGLVCCMQDPSTRLVASANTLQDSRVKGSLLHGLSASHHNHHHSSSHNGGKEKNKEDSLHSPSAAIPVEAPSPGGVTPSVPPKQPQSTPYDEEYFKNNFIQDEMPDDE